MTKVDQFESVFRSAEKQVFSYRFVELENLLIVTDRDEAGSSGFVSRARDFLEVLQAPDWQLLRGDAYRSVKELLDLVAARAPDLIVTYRCLHSQAWRWRYTLGEYLDVLVQEAPAPVLVLHHPEIWKPGQHASTDVVMAMTDHLTGDDRLINHAVRLTKPGGTLFLTHIEDRRIFERYMETISKIASIDTENARQEILRQILKEPMDFTSSCRRALTEAGLPLRVEECVSLGDHLRDHRTLIAEHRVDLLVMNARDEEQLAMHGLAYPLAVELHETPLLLL
ncbi:MAG: hypothetical protein ACE5F1_09875 [Planctomycetota bacterium]